MTPEEEKELKERQAQAKAHWEVRNKELQQVREEKLCRQAEVQSHTTAPQAGQVKNTIRKKQKLQLRKYLLGGACEQNDNMLVTADSFVEFESGKIIQVGFLPWTVVGEMPRHGERVEVTA